MENHRKFAGLHSISSKCFEAANISAVFIDDGIQFDKMHDWQWHKSFAPAVGRILRIEHLAETILNDVNSSSLFSHLMFTSRVSLHAHFYVVMHVIYLFTVD